MNISDTVTFICFLVGVTLTVTAIFLKFVVLQTHDEALRHEIAEIRVQIDEITTP